MHSCLAILIIMLISLGPASAYYSDFVFKFKNCKMHYQAREKLSNDFLRLLEENPEVLKAKNEKYKIDQYCKISFALTEKNEINFDTIAVLKDNKNYDYNLKLIELLREINPQFKIKSPLKKIILEAKYLAF